MIIVCGILVNNPISFNQNYAITSSTLQGNYVLLANKNNDRCLVINGITNKNEIVDALNNKNISYLDSIVVNKYSYNQFDLINDLIVKYKVDDLYISQIHSYDGDFKKLGEVLGQIGDILYRHGNRLASSRDAIRQAASRL